MKPLSFLQKNRVDLSSISEVRKYITEWPRFLAHPVYYKRPHISRDLSNDAEMSDKITNFSSSTPVHRPCLYIRYSKPWRKFAQTS